MRIAVITTSYPSHRGDPSGHFVRSEARQLAAQGHDVCVMCPGAQGRGAEFDAELTVRRLGGGALFGWPGAPSRLRQRPWRALHLLPFARHLRREVQHSAPDQIIAHWLVPCAWPLLAGSHRPLQAVAHGSDVRLLLALPRRLRDPIIAALLTPPNSIRFVSQELKRALQSAVDSKLAARLHAAPVEACPVDTQGAPSRSSARRELGVGDEFLAVIVGRLLPAKRVDCALRCPDLPSNARRVVVGDGPLLQRYRAQFPEAAFTGRLPRDECLRWIAAADVLLNASAQEGAPSVVREARALGTPVWSSDVGDVALWAATDPGIRLMPSLEPPPGR